MNCLVVLTQQINETHHRSDQYIPYGYFTVESAHDPFCP